MSIIFILQTVCHSEGYVEQREGNIWGGEVGSLNYFKVYLLIQRSFDEFMVLFTGKTACFFCFFFIVLCLSVCPILS